MKNNWDRDKYKKAWDFASVKHSGQYYGAIEKGVQIEYLNHLGTVSMEMLWFLANTKNTYNADLAVLCAILHDTLEDTNATFVEIEAKFGKDVANGVLALTKNMKLPKAEQMQDSLDRIKQQPKEVWLVKLADRISNLSAPAHYWNNDKIKSYREEAKVIYSILGEADELMAKRLEERIERYLDFLSNSKKTEIGYTNKK